jgi:coenzyme F420-dependent glucose-6-phosphate dehydrogenase
MAKSRLRFGYKASAEQFGPVELLEFTVEAERRGFDSVFISDHFQPWRHTDGHAPMALAWLGAAGASTRRVLLGTSVLTPTFRYHPAVVAQAFATLGVMFPGRVVLGVGTGEHLNEGALGQDWPELGERFGRLREALALIKRLWSEESVTIEGAHYSVRNATIYDRPASPIPIYVAASGPQTAKYAGRAADGFICTSGKGMELYRDSLLPALLEGEAAAGREPGSTERMIEMKVAYSHDHIKALADTRIWAALALPADAKVGIDDPREMERRAAEVADQAYRRWLVADTADAHVEQIRPYIDLGFTHLVFHAPGDDQMEFLRLYGEEILPRLRALEVAAV